MTPPQPDAPVPTDPAEAEAELARLREEIHRHQHLYYVLDRPEISDDAFDRLFQRLLDLEEAHPDLVTPDSPSRRVGAEPQEKFDTVEHAAPMLSLDSTKDEDGVRRFDERVRKAVDREVRYVLEPKLDGASIELVYEAGTLIRAVTRGNGREGEDVSANARTIPSVPLRLREGDVPAPPFLSVRGEVFMLISTFERYNERLIKGGEAPYASPRNSASGALRQLDPRLTAQRELECVAYDVLRAEGVRFERDREVMDALRAWGFRLPERVSTAESVDEIVAYHRAWADDRDRLDYEIDGVVIKLDDLDARAGMGATSHHPRWALAFKFEPRKEVTRVERIMVSVGRTGVLTPVALLRPVTVGGVTISRASLHNREEVERKDVREGDLVRIQRAGDVIPQVVERVDEPGRERSAPFAMPERCPVCDAEVHDSGPFTVCPNRFGCRAQLVARLVHFGGRSALDIEGLGEETVRLLVDRGLVGGLADLFDLEPEQLVDLPGFGETSAANLVAGVRSRTRPDLGRFLHGLGIPGVGATVAAVLARELGSLVAVLEADPETLEAIDGVGPKMSEGIRAFLDEPRNRAAIKAVLERGVEPVAEARPAGDALAGQKFVFTGGLERFARSRAKQLVEQAGARVVGSVSGSTSYVVVGTDPGSKADKAAELGVPTLDEAQFLELLREAGVDLH